jgi:hypothetical protein
MPREADCHDFVIWSITIYLLVVFAFLRPNKLLFLYGSRRQS